MLGKVNIAKRVLVFMLALTMMIQPVYSFAGTDGLTSGEPTNNTDEISPDPNQTPDSGQNPDDNQNQYLEATPDVGNDDQGGNQDQNNDNPGNTDPQPGEDEPDGPAPI